MSCTIQEHIDELRKRNALEGKQIGGRHYQVTDIQPWDIIDAYHLDPYTANIIKYALRFPYKAGRQDIEKLIHYAEKLHLVYDDVKEHYYAGA